MRSNESDQYLSPPIYLGLQVFDCFIDWHQLFKTSKPCAFFLNYVCPKQLKVCGILGLLLHDPNIDAAPEICEGLSLLQHRGQDACGIITCGPKGRFYQCKANGMVRDIFDANSISRLIGGMGVGHGMWKKNFEESSLTFFFLSQSAILLQAVLIMLKHNRSM